MAPDGLKVGDTFLEGNLVYEVTKVGGEYRYEARWTGKTSSGASVVKPEPKVDYASMQYAQLKKLCAERGLDATGKKEDLVARLEG
jgi:hypothetical protein